MSNVEIERIAKVLDECCNVYDEKGRHVRNMCNSTECEYWSNDNYCCCSYNKKEATAIYNAGYQRVDKDDIVISRKEYEALKLIESYHVKSCGKDTITLSKTELEALAGAFVDSTAKLVNKSTKDLADKIYQLSEEWPGGVVFWKKARKLCIEYGAED
jgi:hypothetical protein